MTREPCPCRWRLHEYHHDWWHHCILHGAEAGHVHICECGARLTSLGDGA